MAQLWFTLFLWFHLIHIIPGSSLDYRGKLIGKLNTYHHQVSGDVYAINDHTFLIRGFTYDGNGPDAYFWAGVTNRPGNQGFLVPNEYNRTNVLSRYYGKDVMLRLLDNRRITELRWLAVYDLSLSATYGDITIPEGFEPPIPQPLTELSQEGHEVKSGVVIVLNSKSLLIPKLYYDGKAEGAQFWVGSGPQPNRAGRKIPDENGYLGPIHPYSNEDIRLDLPGNMTLFEIDWLSIYDTHSSQNLGSVLIPGGLNVPPAQVNIIKNENRLPNCEQLHRKLQVSWDVFGPQITIQLAGQIGDNDYMAFGISGSENSSVMIGSDVAVTYKQGLLGYAIDYNITDKSMCVSAGDTYRGMCTDQTVGGLDDIQLHTAVQEDGITKITYLRLVNSADSGDKQFADADVHVVWAVGSLSTNKEPLFHYLYPKENIKIRFTRSPAKKNCDHFTEFLGIPGTAKSRIWEPRILHAPPNITAVLGPDGGTRGYLGSTGRASPGLVWYINGLLAPEVYVVRGQRYQILVYGGNNADQPRSYHPFYITDDPVGGYETLTPEQRKNVKVHIGVDFDRRGRPIPKAVGALCMWENKSLDLRQSEKFWSFARFRNSLDLRCEPGDPGRLMWYPNVSTPDLLYYQSFRQPHMGWKIHVVDTLPPREASSSARINAMFSTHLLLVTILALGWR